MARRQFEFLLCKDLLQLSISPKCSDDETIMGVTLPLAILIVSNCNVGVHKHDIYCTTLGKN